MSSVSGLRKKSPASFTSDGRQKQPRTDRGHRCRKSSRALARTESAMFYDTRKNDHGLPHNPFKAIVAPRPIGWITSMSNKGEINLAPYSFFNGVTDKPPIVMFSSEGANDSVAFAEETKEFVCSLATGARRDQTNG